MIDRLYLKEHFSFGDCELGFKEGLIAFTGPSGAGKSLLMQALLSIFGYGDVNATVLEADIAKSIEMSDFGIENEEINVFRAIKSKSTRYFINSQSISRKNINEISKRLINYLSVKDSGEFENERLLELVDAISSKNNPTHEKNLNTYRLKYEEFNRLNEELDNLIEREKKIEELKDFARFEIARIDEVSPKIGEDEELQLQKKILSKKEKITLALEGAMGIFQAESSVTEALSLMDEESAFFDECMNELRAKFETGQERLDELDDIDVEALLERIEKIAGLKKRYGSIEDILEYRDKKAKELKEYENITFTKDELQKSHGIAKTEVEKLAFEISKTRQKNLYSMNIDINNYLNELYMSEVKLSVTKKPIDEFGVDMIEVNLGSVELKKISSGEYNRLRLAFLATRHEYLQGDGGVLILDEIDSNLSGKESMSVANVLLKLSKKYQIFAISHQPQLSSRADMHFLVQKEEGKSMVKLLSKKQRIEELARMVSGEEIHTKAIEFAKSLME